MNRCRFLPAKATKATVWLALALGLSAGLAVFQPAAQAQPVSEASAGGRHFPQGTLRGKLQVVNSPEILLDGRAERLAPGARILSAQNMLTMPAAVTGQPLLVNYRRDAAGLVSQVWVLTPAEASVKRAGVERPLLNIWPFVARSAPHDDGKTPFHLLPKYGE